MPNIHAYGFQSDAVCARIFTIFEHQPFVNDMVVTTHPDTKVRDKSGNPQPYLQVWSTDKKEAFFIYHVLRVAGFDVERPKKLAAFNAKPMWTYDEIMEDLGMVRQGKRSFIGGSLLAKQLMEEHRYHLVAEMYGKHATCLEIQLGGWRPSAQELTEKVDVDDIDYLKGEAGAKTRLTMCMQIADSLDPPKKPKAETAA